MNKELTDLESALKKCRSSFIAIGGFSMFINMLMLVPAFYMLQVYDRVVTSGSIPTLIMLTLVMLLLMSTMGALEWVRSRIMVRVSTRLDTMLSDRLFNASFKQALYSGGAVTNAQPLSDLTGLRQFLTGAGLFAFFDAPWVPIYIGIMFMFHPWFGVMAIISVVFLSLIALINEKTTRPLLDEANKENMGASQFVSKNLRNAEIVESMGMLGDIRSRWQSKSSKVLSLQGSASDRAGILQSISKTSRLIVQSLVLGLGAYLVILQELSPGLMIAGSILLGRALGPIDQMIGVWKQFVSARSQYKRLNELLEKVPEDAERMSLPVPKGNISAEAAIVGAPGTRTPIIKGVSFQIKAGDTVGIIGPSASGKSTLARAILGIWPTLSGKVRLDGADVFQWKRDELGPHIGYLPQDIELFEGTISENIARFGEVDPDKVVAAARMSGVHEMILTLPEGYDTQIAVSGGGLSGGQRQRIGLARALYDTPKLVILDEPNSNLDDQGEQALASAIQQLKASGSTIIVITHRSQILAQVDMVMMLADGAVKMFGPRDQVLKELAQSRMASAGKPPVKANAEPTTSAISKPQIVPVNKGQN